MATDSKIMDLVQDYYGRVLRSNSDLKTTACCATASLPPALSTLVAQIHPEVRETFYGCGIIAPAEIESCTVLDLGCGSGRDAYVLSKLVGASGRVIGIDMTDAQLAVARRHQDYHAEAFGYSSSNIKFTKGFIEDLETADIPTNSVDVVVSNCVINLSPAKERVFAEIFRVLKPGGELCFSDVFVDRRLPHSFMDDQALLGECLGGAIYKEDFRRLMAQVGCCDFRVMASAPIAITHPGILAKTGNARFQSLTIRAFKLDLEDRCEDYGQVAYYLGSIAGQPHSYLLDDHHVFETNRPMLVCSNTAKMLSETRLARHFRVEGDTSTHYGLFDCGPASGTGVSVGSSMGACC